MTRERVYLKHILDAISDIKKFTEDLTKEEFAKTKKNGTLSCGLCRESVKQQRQKTHTVNPSSLRTCRLFKRGL